MPIFSIVIPTRNRPSLAVSALTSAARPGADCEIILSDNSTEATAVSACRAAAAGLKDDPQVRYVPPQDFETDKSIENKLLITVAPDGY